MLVILNLQTIVKTVWHHFYETESTPDSGVQSLVDARSQLQGNFLIGCPHSPTNKCYLILLFVFGDQLQIEIRWMSGTCPPTPHQTSPSARHYPHSRTAMKIQSCHHRGLNPAHCRGRQVGLPPCPGAAPADIMCFQYDVNNMSYPTDAV